METPYRFHSLDQYTREDVRVLNRVYDLLPSSTAVWKMLSALADSLMRYDICNVAELEIRLVVKSVSQTGKPQVNRFQQPIVSIGRTGDNDLTLKSPLVSKKHAEIFVRGAEVLLRDLHSNNGTYLNRARLQPGMEVVLKSDDVIRVEPFDITVSLPADVQKKPLEIGLANIRSASHVSVSSQVALLLNLLPAGNTVFLLLDRESARWLIRKVITGQKDSGLPGWTEIETGLLEYLACQMIALLNPFLEPSRVLFQSIESETPTIQQRFNNQRNLVELTFGAQTEIGMLYALLYMEVPGPETQFANPTPSAFLNTAPWLRNLKYVFSIQLGHSSLAADQIGALEEGDVILLDHSDMGLDADGPKGRVELRSKHLQRGTIRGSLNCDGKGYSTITVDTIDQEGLKRMSEANKKGETTQPQSGDDGLLSGVEVPIVIEFARISFTLEELASVKEGQIIEMEKIQPEVVDLSVDGKVIGNGKLVDVEGKLGVRILKMVKPK